MYAIALVPTYNINDEELAPFCALMLIRVNILILHAYSIRWTWAPQVYHDVNISVNSKIQLDGFKVAREVEKKKPPQYIV